MEDLLVCYYGDDFTGSTDAMGPFSISGLKTVLFLEPPSLELLESHFPDLQCLGVAGVSRSMNPSEMEAELRPIFEKLRSYRAPITFYKVCSTFDSSPEVESIGRVYRHRKRNVF